VTASDVVGTVLGAIVVVSTTGLVVSWAVQPRHAVRRGAIRFLRIFMPVWVIVLLIGGSLSLHAGISEFGQGRADGWQGTTQGALALACFLISVWAYRTFRKRRFLGGT
jgi:hypothetical protein